MGIAPPGYRNDPIKGMPSRFAPDALVLRLLVAACLLLAIVSVVIFFVGLVRRFIVGNDAAKRRLVNDQMIACVIAFIAALYLIGTSSGDLSDFFVRAGLLAVVGALGNGYKSKVSPKGSPSQRVAHVTSFVCIMLVPVCVFVWWWLVTICHMCVNYGY